MLILLRPTLEVIDPQLRPKEATALRINNFGDILALVDYLANLLIRERGIVVRSCPHFAHQILSWVQFGRRQAISVSQNQSSINEIPPDRHEDK